MIKKSIYKILIGASLLITASSCSKDFLDVKPKDQVVFEEVFSTIAGAESALHGIHRYMYSGPSTSSHAEFGFPSIAMNWDLYGEDMVMEGTGSGWFVDDSRLNTIRNGSGGGYIWSFFFNIINNANNILANIDAIETDEVERKAFVKASAHFYRAYAYYNLSNCFMFTYAGNAGGELPGSPTGIVKDALCVPIYLEPATEADLEGKERAKVSEVYKVIIDDLKNSILNFENATTVRNSKSEININVAKGLYARVALVMHDWSKAAEMASEARQGYPLATGRLVYDGFTDAKNAEWIWGSIINSEQNGIYASFLSHIDYFLNGYAAMGMQKKMNAKLMTTYINDTNDLRTHWFVTRDEKRLTKTPLALNGQKKFKAPYTTSFSGDFPLMRSSEMYLIEAEARALNGQLAVAKDVLLEYGLTRNPNFNVFLDTLTTPAKFVRGVRDQRRVELWGEGFRYFDIMRSWGYSDAQGGMIAMDRLGTGYNSRVVADATLVQPWSTMYLYRIPISEINSNNKMVQNP